MPQAVDPRRRCLKVAEWAPLDRALWDRITGPVDLLDENRTRASKWRPATWHKNRSGYGRWHCFLKDIDADLTLPPADRVTPGRVKAYIAELHDQGVQPYTIQNRIGELLAVILAWAPDRDWAWLKRKLADLNALAKDAHEPKPPPLLANEIQAICRARLKTLAEQPHPICRHPAVEYRDTFMILLLTLLPLRLRNLAALSERHLKTSNGGLLVDIPAAETKTGVALVAPIPDVIAAHLAHYRTHVRPILLGERESDRLWLNWNRQPMSTEAVYQHITKATRKLLGQSINPHMFRHIGATTISIVAPEEIDTARALLGHRTSKSTRDHYIVADGIKVSRSHAALIRSLRKRLPGAKPKRSTTTDAGLDANAPSVIERPQAVQNSICPSRGGPR